MLCNHISCLQMQICIQAQSLRSVLWNFFGSWRILSVGLPSTEAHMCELFAHIWPYVQSIIDGENRATGLNATALRLPLRSCSLWSGDVKDSQATDANRFASYTVTSGILHITPLSGHGSARESTGWHISSIVACDCMKPRSLENTKWLWMVAICYHGQTNTSSNYLIVHASFRPHWFLK